MLIDWIAGVLVAAALMLTAPQAQAAPARGAGAPPDVDAYVAAIGPALGQLGDGVGAMSVLMSAPEAGADWRAAAEASFEDVRAGHAALRGYTAPAGFEDAHAALVAATQHCADGADVAQAAIGDGEVAGLYAATQLLVRCAEGIEAFGTMLDGMR